ncbi:MAG: DbpA RNA binding domain-containing protein, partial [Gammaproteobacteria bacterium]
HIVGAIANEAGLDSQYIDNISIHDDYSTVDLPEGMPKDVLRHLQKTWICGQPMRIHRLGEDAPAAEGGAGKPRRTLGVKQSAGDKPARAGKPRSGDLPPRRAKPAKPLRGKPDKAAPRKPRRP